MKSGCAVVFWGVLLSGIFQGARTFTEAERVSGGGCDDGPAHSSLELSDTKAYEPKYEPASEPLCVLPDAQA